MDIETQVSNHKWYDNKAIVIILLILFFPVGLFALWKNQAFSKKTKWIVTGVIAFLVIVGMSTEEPSTTEPTTQSSKQEQLHPIVCDEFKVLSSISGSTVNFSIQTDLPDSTIARVSISRKYKEVGSSSDYSLDYFSEKGTVGKWRSNHSFTIDDKQWTKALRSKQEEVSRLDIGFDVASISDSVTVNFLVTGNQPDPIFGKRNSNLTGKAVSGTSFKTVENEVSFDLPMDTPPIGKSSFPSLNPLNLDLGQKYIVVKRTPLMPSPKPADPALALSQMKEIQAGGSFIADDIFKDKYTLWYRVVAYSADGKEIGSVWINSSALIGQKLEFE